MIFKKVLFASVLLLTLAGCCESHPQSTSTGTVRNIWVRVGTDVTFEHDNGQVSIMHFCSSDSPPPMWAGMKVKLTFYTEIDGQCTKVIYLERLDK